MPKLARVLPFVQFAAGATRGLRTPPMLICFAAYASFWGAQSLAHSEPGSMVRYQPYFYEYAGQRVVGELGRFEVPERYDHPDGAKVTLAFLRLKSTSSTPGPPIVYLAGGPGGSAIHLAKGARGAVFLKMRAAGDVIALEQRGVGLSEPKLDCEEHLGFPLDQSASLATLRDAFEVKVRDCAALWRSRGRDLSAYTVVESAHDMESLRRALHVPKIRLWGSSYGTTLGLTVLRYHGEHVDRAIFAGVEGPDSTLKFPDTTKHQLETLATLIAADPRLEQEIPDFKALLQKVLQSAASQVYRVPLAANGDQAVVVTLGRFDLEQIVIGSLGDREGLASLPRLLLDFDHRNLSSSRVQEAAKEIAGQRSGPVDSMMSLATDCSSGASAERLAEIDRQTKIDLLTHIDFPIPDICPAVGVPTLPAKDRMPVHSAVPTLFMSGTLDGRTPRRNEEEVRRYFTHAQSILIEGAGHGDDLFVSSPAIGDAMVEYMLTGNVKAKVIQDPPLRFR
ncbi:alpha/beta fold hydrolase [Terriglobus sp. RCC_193]|uniref:alpha/beta fold hydrolase n=1 Tax=Terriglobus sp. RCC_193 TaxID=3239218 RepID=UPI003523B765